MDEQAHVTKVDALGDFRAALLKFQSDAADAPDQLRMEVERADQWLEHDRPTFWRNEVKANSDRVAEARLDLERCRMRKIDGEPPACYDEQKALAAAKRRLAISEEKVEAVRAWRQQVAHESVEFAGRQGQLSNWLQADLPRTVAALERRIAAIDAYLTAAPPRFESPSASGPNAQGP